MENEITVGDILRLVADGEARASDVIRIYYKQPRKKYGEKVWRGFKRIAFCGNGQVILEHDKEYQEMKTRLKEPKQRKS